MYILTGDIGGTHTRLALLIQEAGRFRIVHLNRYASRDFDGLQPIIERFLHDYPDTRPQQAAFGVAGPVVGGRCKTTNLPWEVSGASLSSALGIPTHLLNDLEALAWGIDTLDDTALISLQTGQAVASGNQAVIAAGTGLGQAGLTFDGIRHRPFACEGGHTDFAAQTERDNALLKSLQARYGHVSWERMVSGPGLVEVFQQVLDTAKVAAPDWLGDPRQEDAAARISQHALAEDDTLCVEALDWFIELYGREAGNLALKLNTTGGIYLGGGIAPKILARLGAGRFIEAFLDKGRMGKLLSAMPVKVICDEQTALYGLARYAGLTETT